MLKFVVALLFAGVVESVIRELVKRWFQRRDQRRATKFKRIAR